MRRDKRMFVAVVLALTVMAIGPKPARALDNPLTVNLRGATSHLQEASATIFGSGSNVLIDVTRYRAVPDGAALTLNAGPCKRPGRVAFRLAPFGKHGSVTELRHSISDVAAHVHSMVIHKTASTTSAAFACGRVID